MIILAGKRISNDIPAAPLPVRFIEVPLIDGGDEYRGGLFAMEADLLCWSDLIARFLLVNQISISNLWFPGHTFLQCRVETWQGIGFRFMKRRLQQSLNAKRNAVVGRHKTSVYLDPWPAGLVLGSACVRWPPR